ncbi:MAG: hypothetical protein ACIARR_06990 [Phycisphaerales bacterium JB059]
MNTTLRTTIGLAFASLALMSGCVVAVGNKGYTKLDSDSNRVVSRAQFEHVVEANKSIHLGMPRETVLATYPADLLTKFETAQYDGRDLEVWQAHAVTRHGDRSFQRWLYFVDGSLVEMSRQEIDYRDQPDVLHRWLDN